MNSSSRPVLFFALLLSTFQLRAQEPKAGLPPGLPPAERRTRPLPPGIKALRDIEYVPGGGRSRSLDVYLPEKADAPLPLIVWIHGGGWSAGSKDGNQALRLMDAGFATASINYRLSQEAIFPAQIEDCKAAIRFLRAHAKDYNIDPNRIGVWGSSAGGHLVALVGTSGDVKELEGRDGDLSVSSRVQAVCDWYGPTDLGKMGEQSGPESKMDHNAPNSPESRLLGGPVQDKLDVVKVANPITYVSKDDPAFLIMHGDRDPLVPLAQSRMLDAALKAVGVESTLYVVEGCGHGGQGFDKPEAVQMIRDFFVKHLKAAK